MSKKDVASVLLTPVAITKADVDDVLADGYVTRDQVCAGAYARACTDAGIG